jgi:8-oxo-dGTP pyrophosphatase MutT (NUDIX family)
MQVSSKHRRGSYRWQWDILVQLHSRCDEQLETILCRNWTQYVVVRGCVIPHKVRNRLGLYKVLGPNRQTYYVNHYAFQSWPSHLPLVKVRLHLFVTTPHGVYAVVAKCGPRLVLIGGGMTKQDTCAEDAVKRECFEETGIVVDQLQRHATRERRKFTYGHVTFRGDVIHYSAVVNKLPEWYPPLQGVKVKLSSSLLRQHQIHVETENVVLFHIDYLPKQVKSILQLQFLPQCRSLAHEETTSATTLTSSQFPSSTLEKEEDQPTTLISSSLPTCLVR